MSSISRRTIKADIVLPIGAERACDELSDLISSADDPWATHLTVGPGRGPHAIAKKVRATLTPAVRRGSTHLFTLHWEPLGRVAMAYPTLDAKLGITPVDEITSLLSIAATYTPPLGALGAKADHAALSRVADATVVSLLHRLATEMTATQMRYAARTSIGV